MSSNPPAWPRRVLHSLWLGLVLLCAAGVTALGQQAQTVKSSQPIVCDGKNYQLRLVSAEAPIGADNAKALGIVLTPQDGTGSKVFCLYWMKDKSPSPTNRDDTSGTGDALRDYGSGQVNGKPVVEYFFNEAKCLPEDAQVIGIKKLLDEKRPITHTGLHDLASQLKTQNVSVDGEQVEEASGVSLDLFRGLSEESDFAGAIRRYVTSLLAGQGQTGGLGGGKSSWEDERIGLEARIKQLDAEVMALRAEKESFFGGAPRWLIIGFLTALFMILASIAYVVWAWSHPANQESPSTKFLPPPSGPPQISEPLAAIIKMSHDWRQGIEQAHPEAQETDAAQNQKAKEQDNLAETIANRLLNGHVIRTPHYPQAKRAIEIVLGEGKDTTSRRADAWHRAYTELQKQLENFQKSLSHPNGEMTSPPPPSTAPSGAEHVPLAVQELKASIEQLVTDVDAMKTSVDGFGGKLTANLESSRALQDIWWHWYGRAYTGGPIDGFLQDMGEAIDFYKFLRERSARPKASVSQTRGYFEGILKDMDDIRKTYLSHSLGDAAAPHEIILKVKSKLSEDAAAVSEYGEIEQLVRTSFGLPNVRSIEIVRQVIDERVAVKEKLGKYHPGLRFVETVDAVVANYEAITATVNGVLPSEGRSVSEAVASLAASYASIKPEAERAQQLETERDDLQQKVTAAHTQLEAGKELVEEIALELNFKSDGLREDAQAITRTLDKLKREKDAGVYLQLRLGLSSALLGLERAINSSTSEEQRDVIEALRLDRVKKGVTELLAGMEEYSGPQLWEKALSEAFSQKWLHYLIRADLLLRTYYADLKEFGLLRRAVSVACSALLAALSEFQVEVVEVGLFDELPENMETEDVYAGLRNLPAVRDKVRAKMRTIQAHDVVVDVTSFPYSVKGVQENPGRASLANPSAWLQY